MGRAEDLEGALQQVIDAAGSAEDDLTGTLCSGNEVLQKLHAQPLDVDLLATACRSCVIPACNSVCAFHHSRRQLAPAIIKGGIDLLIVQGTLISAEHVHRDGEPLDLREFIGSLDVPVIAGGVVDYTTAMHLMRTGPRASLWDPVRQPTVTA